MNGFTIRPNKSRIILFFILISVFACVSLGLIIVPPRTTSIIPFNRTLQPIVGTIGLLFGLVGYVALLIRMQKPIIRLDEQEIFYFRNQAHIPWQDIRKIEQVKDWGGQKVRWIYVHVTNPDKYAAFEKTNKKFGLIEADMLFDFSLATHSDYEKVFAFMQQYVH
ncbi:MAG: hypothetical protein DHS20C20_18470 [Ardenticatenaceae bacterium]|nr:MAG: hypothetical protein DHS20C20_18470 [Ardenticatenaceae bacterium]